MDHSTDPVGAMSLSPQDRRVAIARLAGVLGLLALGCVDIQVAGPDKVVTIKVAPDTVVLRVGDSAIVRASPLDASAAWVVQRVAGWVSSAPAIASIDAAGLVRGVASGVTTITASVDGVEGTAVVLVSATPSTIALFAGSGQTAAVNAPVPIAPAVRVTDAGGTPVPGVTVTFTPGAGSGIVSPSTTAVTSFDGVALPSAWILGPAAGPMTLQASVVGAGVTGNPVAFSATATVGAPSGSQSSISVGSASIAPSNGLSFTTVTVTVRDAAGSTVMGASVALSSTGGGNIITQPSVTNALGRAVGAFSSTVAGTKIISAVVNGVTPLVATATVDVSAAVAAGLVVATPAAGAVSNVPFTTQPAVEIRDAFGNPILSSSDPITVSLVGGNGTLVSGTGSFTVNAINGRATFSGLRIKGTGLTRDTLGTGAHLLRFSAPGFAAVTSDTVRVDVSFGYNVVDVFTRNSCIGCHGFTFANTVSSAASLGPCTGLTRVVPFDTLNSVLYDKIRRTTPSCGGVMPTAGLMSAIQIRIVRDWILQGARNN